MCQHLHQQLKKGWGIAGCKNVRLQVPSALCGAAIIDSSELLDVLLRVFHSRKVESTILPEACKDLGRDCSALAFTQLSFLLLTC